MMFANGFKFKVYQEGQGYIVYRHLPFWWGRKRIYIAPFEPYVTPHLGQRRVFVTQAAAEKACGQANSHLR
jgi:ABC-type transport system substrate-binding protein